MSDLPECDIIMKGGITSGVVYPLAASHLAKSYTFRNIGGASAGAIAAAMVAAAEYGRQHNQGGFPELDELPGKLGEELRDLFQPSPSTTPAFNLLTAFIDKERSASSKVLAVITAVSRSAWLAFLITFLVAMVPGVAFAFGLDGRDGLSRDGGNILQMALLWLPGALIVAVVVALVGFAVNTKAAIEGNGFGLCNGKTQQSGSSQPPLTLWLTQKINTAAGLPLDGTPLTFGHLWGPGAVSSFDKKVPQGTRFLDLDPYQRRALALERKISLEVMTTNLTLRRPYRFPFEGREFLFCEVCMAEYFPPSVVNQLKEHGPIAPDRPRSDGSPSTPGTAELIQMRCPFHREVKVRFFPRPPHVPVVIAARLSLSFPGLISAVPLCYVDYGRKKDRRELITVWISDGGIASNFPMHLFDSAWPMRPTFGLNLQPKDNDHGDQWTYLPLTGLPRTYSIASLLEFCHALIDTMHDWVDVSQLTLPAYRGRVAEVRLTSEEGGMNLHMPSDRIAALAERGRQAAAHFDDFDLFKHQLGRFEASMAAVDDLLAGMRDANKAGFAAVISQSDPEYRRTAARKLLELATLWDANIEHPHPAVAPNLPKPVGDLRIVPRQ